VLAAVIVMPSAQTYAQTQANQRARDIAQFPTDDDRDPVVFQRNVIAVADRAVSLAQQMGVPRETLQQMTELRRQMDTFGTPEYAEAAARIGTQIARANREMARIRVRDKEEIPAVSGPTVLMSGSAWAFDPTDIVIAKYPAFDFDAQGTADAEGNPNTSGKVCRDHPSIHCVDDSNCLQDEPCVQADTTSEESREISIFKGCSARPSDESIKNLAIVSAVFEGIMMVAGRVCDQEWFGFNVSLLCIITDLLFLFARLILDFEVMCADRWSGAENQAAYDRLGHLHGDLESAQSSINLFQTNVTNQFSSLNTSLNTSFTSLNTFLGTQFASTNTNINTQFLNTNTSMNTLFTNTNTNIDNHFTSLTTLVTNQFNSLTQELNDQETLFLRAEIERILLHRERMAMYYLPEAQGGQLGLIRQIVQETIDRVAASGETVNSARTWVGYANTDIAAGRYKRAFNYLSAAYFDAIKYVGEQQVPQ